MNRDVADLKKKIRKNSSDPASVKPTVRLCKMSNNMRVDIGLLGRGLGKRMEDTEGRLVSAYG